MVAINEKHDARRALFYRRIGQNIRQLREDAGWTQEQLADLFGWNRDAISKIESGKRPVALYEYLQLLWFLRDVDLNHPGVSLARLLLPPATIGTRQAN